MSKNNEVSTNSEQIRRVLERNVERAEPAAELKKRLLSGRRLVIKHGIDPTSPQIHLGHAVVLWKLRDFQELGHKVVLILGDFTARIGDPSDKSQRRPVLTQAEIEHNLRTYQQQIGKILDLKKTEFRRNSQWLDNLSSWEIIKLSRLVTVGQLLARRNFRERFEKGVEIGLDEFIFPIMQGYDSFAIGADIELGGTDQTFNFEMARRVQKALGQPPQSYLLVKMLVGTDGAKMSKSRGNVVNVSDSPEQMFGKLMALNDDYLEDYLWLATRLSPEKIKELLSQLKQGANPKTIKKILAFEVVKLYYSAPEAKAAQTDWENVFEKGALPQALRELELPKGAYSAVELLVKTGLTSSNSGAKRLIRQGGLKINQQTVDSWDQTFKLAATPLLLQKGKKEFVKINPQ